MIKIVFGIGYVYPEIFEYYEGFADMLFPILIGTVILPIFFFFRGKIVYKRSQKEINKIFLFNKNDLTIFTLFISIVDWAAITFYTALTFSRYEKTKSNKIELNNNKINSVSLIYEVLENKSPITFGDLINDEKLKEIDFSDKKNLVEILVKLNLFKIIETQNSKIIKKTSRLNSYSNP